MVHLNKTICFVAVACAVLVSGSLIPPAVAQQGSLEDVKTAPPPGKRTYETTCAGCHGLDGRGGERAPNIASSARAQRLSNSQLASLVSNGIPGTGMPGFHSLSSAEVRAVVSYLRTLQGKSDAQNLPGDPARGKDVFFGKGECSTCHMVSGEGGFLGPDLSGYGSSLSATIMRQRILSQNRIVPAGYRSASGTTNDGTRVEGVVRNEDNFSIQLLAKDGSFRFFQKSDLKNLEYQEQSLMPTDYERRLREADVNDLVSFLINPTSSHGAEATTGAGKHSSK